MFYNNWVLLFCCCIYAVYSFVVFSPTFKGVLGVIKGRFSYSVVTFRTFLFLNCPDIQFQMFNILQYVNFMN